MAKRYEVLVIEIDEVVEEAVVLLIGGLTVRCFVSYCSKEIKVWGRYEVEFEMVLPDGDCVSEMQGQEIGVEMLGHDFSCIISGYLDGEVYRSFVDFNDQGVHFEYPQFNEKYVEIAVDRIDVSF